MAFSSGLRPGRVAAVAALRAGHGLLALTVLAPLPCAALAAHAVGARRSKPTLRPFLLLAAGGRILFTIAS
jgi:hypothetical protein